jgi:uncharacterized protein (TIGR03086 family)
MHINQFAELRDADRRATFASLAALRTWTPSDQPRPTPCTDWTVADLLAHMTGQQLGFVRAAAGASNGLSDWAPVRDEQPLRRYQLACEAVVDAFSRLDDPEAPVLVPEIGSEPSPAFMAVSAHLVDNVVHAWDVARALGDDVRFDDDVVQAALFVAGFVADDESREAEGAAFAHALPVVEGASALEQLLRLLGRDPSWRSWPSPSDPVAATAVTARRLS